MKYGLCVNNDTLNHLSVGEYYKLEPYNNGYKIHTFSGDYYTPFIDELFKVYDEDELRGQLAIYLRELNECKDITLERNYNLKIKKILRILEEYMYKLILKNDGGYMVDKVVITAKDENEVMGIYLKNNYINSEDTIYIEQIDDELKYLLDDYRVVSRW